MNTSQLFCIIVMTTGDSITLPISLYLVKKKRKKEKKKKTPISILAQNLFSSFYDLCQFYTFSRLGFSSFKFINFQAFQGAVGTLWVICMTLVQGYV